MPAFWSLEAVTHRPHDAVVRDVLDTLGAQGGLISGTNELGGFVLVIRFELPPRAFVDVVARLESVGVHVRDAPPLPNEPIAALEGSLSLRFLANEGDRRVVVPKVPG